ncbi:MAG TPA: bifunctional UDP-sugar hydrolase/5'-nucleotidase, partial [bacterium]|nr:bifunctional UDP-sugar hydrolase/5'-nucleotidase [bacterium]
YRVWLHEKCFAVNIVHTADIHGHVLAEEERDGGLRGGFPSLAAFLEGEKDPYLLLDSGDLYKGAPEGDLTQGRILIELMNKLKYNAAAPGNHEFDGGPEHFRDLVSSSEFSWICANIIEKKTHSLPAGVKPYVILENQGIRFGITGVITAQLPHMTFQKNLEGLEVLDEVESLEKIIPELKEKSDLVVLLSHVGLREGYRDEKDFASDYTIAKALPEIDLILGGHTHRVLKKPLRTGRTRIVQSGCYLKGVSRIRVWFTRKGLKPVRFGFRYAVLDTKKFPPDPGTAELIKAGTGGIYERMQEVIGANRQWVSRTLSEKEKRDGELPLGNMITDIMKSQTGADFAFQNIGGIRADLPAGDLKLRHMYMLEPFDNSLVTMELTGADVRSLMEESVSGSFGFLQFSGLKLVWDSVLPAGKRVLNVLLDGGEIDDAAVYLVATNNFLAGGGDGLASFTRGTNKKDTGLLLRDILVEYVRGHSPLEVKKDGRMTNVSLE